ncbi:SAM-dependent methyltransferase [Enterovibrio norvegicus FF-33]|uniref:methyltransferase n=1 Tax=Enterovibrio norvegicus TaxID=188144 RepID=UPI000371E892|nr:methyltransferase [Enterovibrio norvegicus]OEE70200.1 SAM-dependent methyltransferase [Enterovibrio norvegicus FF-33]
MSQSFLVQKERFLQIDALLQRHVSLWQGMPFDCLDLPWRASHPELCQWLDLLCLKELQAYKESPERLAETVKAWLPEAAQLVSLCGTEVETQNRPEIHCDSHIATGIPGRKWSQITAFNSAIPLSNKGAWLEWCAGKGYLGRVISATRQVGVTSLEWQEALCQDGQAYANQHQLPMHFVHGDAFSPESELLVSHCDHAVALHACGDLHVTLLRHSVKAKPQSLSVSPCCYHLINEVYYQPLSIVATGSLLSLSRHDLKLPLQETVTAGKTVRNKRIVEVSFRLGFDSLQRALGHSDSYLPVPNIQKSLLNEGFEAFCRWAADKKGISIPDNTDFAAFLSQGEQRFSTVEKMETIRTLFRRPLEMWLVLDRALFLSENGFDVDVTTFCARELTPRNLLIQATRKG